MYDFTMVDHCDFWNVIKDGPFGPTKPVKDGEVTYNVHKSRKEFDDANRRKIEKIFMAKKFLVCGIGLDEYNRISMCETAKEI